MTQSVIINHPRFKSFWMWQDRYLVTIMKSWQGFRYTVSLYEEGELLTDGFLYGNDF